MDKIKKHEEEKTRCKEVMDRVIDLGIAASYAIEKLEPEDDLLEARSRKIGLQLKNCSMLSKAVVIRYGLINGKLPHLSVPQVEQ